MTLSIETLNADALALLRRHNILRTLVERQVVDEAVAQASLSEEEQTQARDSFAQRNGQNAMDGSHDRITSWGAAAPTPAP